MLELITAGQAGHRCRHGPADRAHGGDLNADWVKRRIETEVKDRFGVELDAAGGAGALDPQVLSAAVRAQEQLAAEDRVRAEAARVGAAAERVEAQSLMATATLDEQQAEQAS